MDPDATLALARDCANDLRRALGADNTEDVLDASDGLLTAFSALDDWLMRGGHLPGQWERAWWDAFDRGNE